VTDEDDIEDFETLLDLAPDALILVGASGEIEYVNIQAEKLTQISRQELVGQRIETLVPVELRAAHRSHRALYNRVRMPRVMGRKAARLACVRADGREVDVEITLSPLPEGRVLASIREKLAAPKSSWPAQANLALVFLMAGIISVVVSMVCRYLMTH